MQKSSLLYTLLIILTYSHTFAQDKKDPAAIEFANTIELEEIKEHVLTLASDEYEGRATGYRGQKMAAEYISKAYAACGIPKIQDDTHYQKIPLLEMKWGMPSITINQKKFNFLTDFYCFSRGTEALQFSTKKVIFVGYGIDDPVYNSYAGKEVKDQVVLMFGGEPKKADGTYLISGTDKPSPWSTNWRKKPTLALEKEVKLILMIVDDVKANAKKYMHGLMGTSMQLKDLPTKQSSANVVYISKEMAATILKGQSVDNLKASMTANVLPKAKKYRAKTKVNLNKEVKEMEGENLLGYVEGSDLKEELVVITAHYDHLNPEPEEGLIYNGADDNASGTSALIEIAEAFALAKKAGKGPRRSILVMPVAAEEKGLLGSRYYTDVDPIFPLHKTIANLNVDMIGRIDKHHEDGNYLYIIGSDKLSQDLHDVNEWANKTYTQLDLDYTFNAENDPNRFYYRSDHYNFVLKGVPAIFYFNGTHPDYHKATDTVEKLDFEALHKRTQLIFYTAWHLANRNERIKVDPEKLGR